MPAIPKKLFGINSHTNNQQVVHQNQTTFMVVDDPSILQSFYNEQNQFNNNNNNGVSSSTNNVNNGFYNNNNNGGGSSIGNQQQQQYLLASQLQQQQQQQQLGSSIPNNMNNMNMFNSQTNNHQNNSYASNVNGFNIANIMNIIQTNNQQQQQQLGTPSYNTVFDQSNNNNNNSTFLFGQSPSQSNNNNAFIVNNNTPTISSTPTISTTTPVNNHNHNTGTNNQLANVALNSTLGAKYTPTIRWTVAPSTADTFSHNPSTSSMVYNDSDNVMSQASIDPMFSPDDCKVSKGNLLMNTKLFCLSDQTLRDYSHLRPSVQTDNLYHYAEMEMESAWLSNDRIAPKKTSHNCLVNDWLVFCSQDPQLLKLVGRYINGVTNTDMQLFADFVLVTSNNHDEDSRESLFGKQRFKGGIPLQMKLVRSSINNPNLTPLLYFEKRINRESVNNKDAPSSNGMGGKRVAQLRIYLKDNNQEICLVHSDGFWVRTKSRDEIHRTSPREQAQQAPEPVQPQSSQKKKRFGFFQNGSRIKREENAVVAVEPPKIFNSTIQMPQTQQYNQPMDLSQMSNSGSFSSNSYLSNSGYLPGQSPTSQFQMLNVNDPQESSSLGSTPNNINQSFDLSDTLRGLSQIFMTNPGVSQGLGQSFNQGSGHHSRNNSLTNAMASSCGSNTSSSSYLLNDVPMSTYPESDLDATIQKVDSAIQFFSVLKEHFLNQKNNQTTDMQGLQQAYTSFSSSLQDKRKDKGFKRVRQGNESGAVSPQSNQSGKSLNIPLFRSTPNSASNNPNVMNGSSPLVNNMMSNVNFPNSSSFNGTGNVVVTQQNMQTFPAHNYTFQSASSSSVNNLPMKNFDGDLPNNLFADNDSNQDIFNM